MALQRERGISGFPVVKGGKVVGIVTNRDLRFETNLDQPVKAIMTPQRKLVTVREGASRDEAIRLMHEHRLERVLVVDEAFMDSVPGESASLAGSPGRPAPEVPGVVVIRSLTKTWGLAGLRVGYALGPAPLVAALAAQQPHWPVSTPALAALVACTTPSARTEADAAAVALEDHRRALVDALPPGVDVVAEPRSSFVLLRVPDGGRVREALRQRGWAVRRGDTFPGLSPDHLRVAVRDPGTSRTFAAALAGILSGSPAPEETR